MNLTKCISEKFIDLVHMEDSVTDQAPATQVSRRSSWYSGYVHHVTGSTGQTRRLSGVHDFWEGGKCRGGRNKDGTVLQCSLPGLVMTTSLVVVI